MTECMMALVGGLLGSAHCLGMCGSFVITLTVRGQTKKPSLCRQLTYAGGRVFTYTVFGAVAGSIGVQLDRHAEAWHGVRLALNIAATVTLFVVALNATGWLPRFRTSSESCASTSLFAAVYDGSLRTHTFLAGMINGFIPCGLVYAYLPVAMTTANAITGGCVMACFGLGTIPALTALGLGAGHLSCRQRQIALRCASAIMILLAASLLYRTIIDWYASTSSGVNCPLC